MYTHTLISFSWNYAVYINVSVSSLICCSSSCLGGMAGGNAGGNAGGVGGRGAGLCLLNEAGREELALALPLMLLLGRDLCQQNNTIVDNRG